MADENIGIPSIDVYANGLQVALSPFDATIVFGLQQLQTAHLDSTKLVNTTVGTTFSPVARVRISLQTAVVLAEVLKKALNGYEETNGKIVLPAEILDKLGIER